MLAVVKPAGVDVGARPGQTTPGLVELLTAVRRPGERLEPINRLSRFESGVLLLGKEPEIVRTLRADLRAGRVRQEYCAVVLGKVRGQRMAIGPDAGPSPKRDRPRRPGRERAVAPKAKSVASTTLRVLRQGSRRASVRCRTSVPNTHGLRAQLRSVGLRLLGDSLHDRSPRGQRAELTRLHLEKISFRYRSSKSPATFTSRAPEAFDAAVEGGVDVERVLHAALTRRIPLLASRDTNAYRLLSGDFEGLAGLVAERFGEVAILQVHRSGSVAASSVHRVAGWFQEMLGVRAVYVKNFVKDRGAMADDAVSALRSRKPLVGESVDPEIEIIERGLKFAIRPYDGFSVGLFLDHRENRARVRTLASGKDMLNLFAYTCGFSVAAASGGATSTVSVDISPKSLEWGRRNFALNGMDPSEHGFIKSDALDYLARAERQGKRFDLIVLDPPTFAHARSGSRRGKSDKDFSITRNLGDLIAGAAILLRPEGVLMLSTSYRQATLALLREQLRRPQGGSAVAGRRRFHIVETPSLPIDFAADPDHAKVIFARFD